MTDGYYGGNSPGVGNTDNEAGQVITGPGGKSYQYDPAVTPLYRDGHSNTLADVAMDYWKRDLRTDMDNIVGTDERDPAFWQHMVTYNVGMGLEARAVLDLIDAREDNTTPTCPEQDPVIADPRASVYQALRKGQCVWPDADAEARRIDDVWH